MTRLERPHARLLSDLRPAYHNDETGEMQYRYYDDTVCIYNEDNIPADDVLDFILAAKKAKKALGPDGYWKPEPWSRVVEILDAMGMLHFRYQFRGKQLWYQEEYESGAWSPWLICGGAPMHRNEELEELFLESRD